MMYHTPKLPSNEELSLLRNLQIDVQKGKVYKEGREFGHIDSGNGYFKLYLGKRRVKRANVVWWAATGQWPTKMLDHKNTDRTDDSFDNLRYCTNSQNSINTPGGMKSRKGYPKGVSYNPTASGGKNKPFVVWLVRKGRKLYLGRYSDAGVAGKVYKKGLKLYLENPSLSAKEIREQCRN